MGFRRQKSAASLKLREPLEDRRGDVVGFRRQKSAASLKLLSWRPHIAISTGFRRQKSAASLKHPTEP